MFQAQVEHKTKNFGQIVGIILNDLKRQSVWASSGAPNAFHGIKCLQERKLRTLICSLQISSLEWASRISGDAIIVLVKQLSRKTTGAYWGLLYSYSINYSHAAISFDHWNQKRHV